MFVNKFNSPYSAGLTGCGFMKDEMTNILPLLMSPAANVLLRREVLANEHLAIRTETTRNRAVAEFKRRYAAVPISFWQDYLLMSSEAQLVAMFFVILKTYRITFDIQTSLLVNKWKSVEQTLTKYEVLEVINQVAEHDDFVEGWSEDTKGKIASAYLSILRKVGLLDDKCSLIRNIFLSYDEWSYYIKIGEPWFLEACLLEQYEVERIKDYAL